MVGGGRQVMVRGRVVAGGQMILLAGFHYDISLNDWRADEMQWEQNYTDATIHWY